MVKIYSAPLGERDRSDTAYSLLRYAFLKEYGAAFPKIEKTPNGKPYFPDRPEIHFSLSHAKTRVLCALSNKPIGADIESLRTISQRTIAYFCSSDELSSFDPLDLWVLKESYIKLIGGTLSAIKHLRFSRAGGNIIAPDESVISRLYLVDDCRAAISSLGEELPDAIELVNGSNNRPLCSDDLI